jgi:CDP-diacylglycerol--glycerol-3-phosphate 3-phosphatidyltransferase
MPARLTLANRITIVRILATPIFILVTTYYISSVDRQPPDEWLRWLALVLFLVTALTDALDGYVARSRNERTRVGTVLDPLADKALLLSGLLLLSGPWGRAAFMPHIPAWYVLLVVSRDVLLIAGSSLIQAVVGHVHVQPRLAGKFSTVFQMSLIIVVLGGGPVPLFRGLLAAAALFTLLSSIQYLVDGVRQLEKVHAHDPPSGRTR